MEVVILEHENYRGRTDARYQIMKRRKDRNGLNHVYSLECMTLDKCKEICKDQGFSVEAIGGFYKIV